MVLVNETPDHYAILNIGQLASFQEIKKAYHQLALLHHPDKNKGSVAASEMFKKIAAAYETLGDENKRILYDATYTKSSGKADTSGSYRQTTPTTYTYDQYREREKRRQENQESERLRQEYIHWVNLHQWHIDKAEQKVDKIRSEIEALDFKDKVAKDKLAETQSWFTPWTWGKPVVLDEEKQSMEVERLNRNAARTIKQGKLRQAETELKKLKDEKNTKETAEVNRVREEQRKKDVYERAEQAKKETQRRKEQEERLRKQREAQEKATREYLERLRKAREAQEQAEQEERRRQEAERVRKQAEAAKREAERIKRQADFEKTQASLEACYQEARRMTTERDRREAAQKTQRNKTHRKSNNSHFNPYEAYGNSSAPSYACTHKRYWGKQHGRHQCLHCKMMQPKFAFQCPGCNTVACYTCMNKLKRGEIPMPTYERNMYETLNKNCDTFAYYEEWD